MHLVLHIAGEGRLVSRGGAREALLRHLPALIALVRLRHVYAHLLLRRIPQVTLYSWEAALLPGTACSTQHKTGITLKAACSGRALGQIACMLSLNPLG